LIYWYYGDYFDLVILSSILERKCIIIGVLLELIDWPTTLYTIPTPSANASGCFSNTAMMKQFYVSTSPYVKIMVQGEGFEPLNR